MEGAPHPLHLPTRDGAGPTPRSPPSSGEVALVFTESTEKNRRKIRRRVLCGPGAAPRTRTGCLCHIGRGVVRGPEGRGQGPAQAGCLCHLHAPGRKKVAQASLPVIQKKSPKGHLPVGTRPFQSRGSGRQDFSGWLSPTPSLGPSNEWLTPNTNESRGSVFGLAGPRFLIHLSHLSSLGLEGGKHGDSERQSHRRRAG